MILRDSLGSEGVQPDFWPFGTFRIYGQALAAHSQGTLTVVIGFAYHLVNGCTFAVAYVVWFGRRGVLGGILWALFLEACMLANLPRLAEHPAMGRTPASFPSWSFRLRRNARPPQRPLASEG